MQSVLRLWLNPDPMLPEPANQNWVILGPRFTPSGALWEAQLTRQWLLRRAVRQPGLLWDAEWRFTWNCALALERCVIWRYFEQRWPWR
jgi:hypothetical protein